MHGLNLPEVEVNLPPGAVTKAAQQVGFTCEDRALSELEKQLGGIEDKKKPKKAALVETTNVF